MQQYQVYIKLYLLYLIPRSKCEPEGYIVKGDVADIKDFPHSAALSITAENQAGKKKIWGCGSSIINQKTLLTAAHCVDNINPKTIIIARVGSADKRNGTMVRAELKVSHGNYNKYTVTYDIALLSLKTALKFSVSVRRISLVKNPPYSEKAQVAGWGLVDETNKIRTNILHCIDQYVWDRNRCEKANLMSYPGVFCAQSRKHNQYASEGDSGSALVVRGYIQIGIVSYKSLSIDRSVVVYTDTGKMHDWILKMSNALHCHKRII